MTVEPVGLATLVLGLYCLSLGLHATVKVFIVLTLLGAAAAFTVGSASVQPAHLFLLFVAISIMRRRAIFSRLLAAISFGTPGFWLVCLVLYGGLSAYFLPKAFADATLIVPLGVSDHPLTSGVVRLGPISSNFTQTVYLAADLVAFAMIVMVGSSERGIQIITTALVAYGLVNLLFVVVDLGASSAGLGDVMQFVRNADYTLHDDDQVNGMKRIVGSWPEASAFAGTTLGIFGFLATMWLCGRWTSLTGALAALSLLAIILSTSSTGLVAAPGCVVILYLTALSRCGTRRRSTNSNVMVVLAIPLTVVGILVVLLHQDLFRVVYDYVDLLILSKSTTDSGVSRAAWNTYGMQNFYDTYGLGAGLGTARTSSFMVALLSNVGAPGAVFFLLFAISAFMPSRLGSRSFASDTRLCARNACLCLLVGGMIAGPTVDLGLLFFIFAGLAARHPEEAKNPKPYLRASTMREFARAT